MRWPIGVVAVALLGPAAGSAQERTYCRSESAGSKGYVVERIAGAVYCVSVGGQMGAFLATDSGVVIVDAPPAIMDQYLAAIREVTAAPVMAVIYSHSHADHIAGAHRLPAAAPRIAHEETARTLARRNDPLRPLPTRTFTLADTLRVGREILVLRYHGPNHDLGQILIHAPRERVLIGIDLYNGGNAPWFRLAGARDVPGLLALHDSIMTYDFDVFIGGHGRRTGTRRDLETQRSYLRDVAAFADSAAAQVEFAAATAGMAESAHPFEKVSKFYRDQIARCTALTLARWRGRLSGVELTTPSHCEAMLESRRVD